jgi:Xaa-Pro aminopeptidase
MLRAGGIPAGDSIVAGGEQACDPHERGHGTLRAHELIIIDLFPRDAKSHYYGDLTRTVVRGKASEAQRHLWESCCAGQRQVLASLWSGASGKKIHQELERFFAQEGYPKEQKNGRWSGFFHGTGHSLGLEVHDGLRFSTTCLKLGHVFTIEPGLYIPGLGGVRQEDVVVITEKGYRLLSHFPKILEI